MITKTFTVHNDTVTFALVPEYETIGRPEPETVGVYTVVECVVSFPAGEYEVRAEDAEDYCEVQIFKDGKEFETPLLHWKELRDLEKLQYITFEEA